MNIVILGILTKMVLIALGLLGLLLALTQRLAELWRRQVLPAPAVVRIDSGIPLRVNTRRWVILPSRAPPTVALIGPGQANAANLC